MSKRRNTHDNTWPEITKRTKAAGYTWKTRDGKVLTPKEFTDPHLANSLRMLQRKAALSNAYAEPMEWRVAHSPLLDEAHRRGLEWEVPTNTRCAWSGPVGGCSDLAVMLSVGDPQIPLCEEHRPERLLDVPCAGCFLPKQIVAQSGKDYYCAECTTPLGWLAFLLLYISLLVGRRAW